MTGTEGTKGAMSDCLPALIAPRIRVVLYCRQQEYESLATPPHTDIFPPSLPANQAPRRNRETSGKGEEESRESGVRCRQARQGCWAAERRGRQSRQSRESEV